MKKNQGLKAKYQEEVRQKLVKEFSLASLEAAPKMTKIVVNMGTADQLKDQAVRERLMMDLAKMTGQRPTVRPARKSVAGFGIREGNPVGLTVTLRRGRMYDFFERLVSVVLPRLRDFRGLSLKSFDKDGNYTVGLRDYSVFPEVGFAKLSKAQGMEVTIVTDARDKAQARVLLECLGMPFEKEKK